MITKEDAIKWSNALKALREKNGFDPSKHYKWSICKHPYKSELMICGFSSIVSACGFVTRREAEEFINNPDNEQILKDVFLR